MRSALPRCQFADNLPALKMKVLHISWSDQLDSSSRAAAELHRGLLKEGVESKLLVKHAGGASAEGIEQLPSRDEEETSLLQSFCLSDNEAEPTDSAFHIGHPGVSISAHPAVLDCDLIHLHQVAGAISPTEIRALAALGKPLVWSLPDAWAFTGGCFQPGTCARYTEECAHCPQLHDDGFHLPSRLLADKVAQLSGIKNLTLVVPNQTLAVQARASRIFESTRIESIAPVMPRAAVPSRSGPLRIVFVCDSPGSQDRSVRLLNDLLELTQTYGGFRKLVLKGAVTLVFSGVVPGRKISELPIQFTEATPTLDADLLVFTKADENRHSAILEARAYGIPVLAFDQAGIGEVIQHRKNGWLVARAELRTMAEALGFLAASPDLVRGMASAPSGANEQALANTIALYQDLLKATDAASAPAPVGDSLTAQLQKVIGSIARLAVTQRAAEERLAQLDAIGKRVRGADQLFTQAQASLTSIERRQKKLIQSGQLSQEASKELGKIQKAASSLRSKLKWRSRRLRINSSPHHFLVHPGKRAPLPATPPKIPVWIQFVYSSFLKNHWMRHGNKDQYSPRPVRPEHFPKPKLRESKLPRIAIVTPSFQQGDFLEATIKSVVDQNYPNLSYAVHDGGSTDSTLEVIRRYEDRLTLWSSQPDSGQSRAIISGFEKISGDIMAWLNSDDLLMPGTLRYVGEYFAAHPEVDAIYGNRIIINEHGQEMSRWVLPPHDDSITPFLDPVPQETLFWRASLWQKVGGLDASFRYALDWDLVLRFQKAGAKIVRLPYFLGCFRIHSLQKTTAQAESLGAEEIAYLRLRETGDVASMEQLDPYRRWIEACGAVYSRMLELGIRL